MRVFAIKDETLPADRILGYLIYYQQARVEVQPGGHGICWNEQAAVADRDLHDTGETVPLAQADFLVFVRRRLLSTAEAAQMLGCSRQNINDLTKRGKLHPIRSDERQTLFLRSEVEQRMPR